MNVGHPSNLARLIDLYGGWLDESGNLKRSPDMKSLKREIYAISISDQTTRSTIMDTYKKYKCVLEPHGAVGWAGMELYFSNVFDSDIKLGNLAKRGVDVIIKSKVPFISLETADPSKFPEIIRETLNMDPPMPKHLADVQKSSEKIINMKTDYNEFKQFLLQM